MVNNIVVLVNLCYSLIVMQDYNSEFERQEALFKELYTQAAYDIRNEIAKFKPDCNCNACTIPCDIQKPDIFEVFPPGCPYGDWQIKTMSFLANEYKDKLRVLKKELMEKKKNYSCNKCGNCCKLAVSGYNPMQLKQRALRGDKYAKEFSSIYVPYESEEMAEAICPEYYNKLKELMNPNERLYFYYCSKLGADDLCSDYENRPDICRDYPFTPLKVLPDGCGYSEWHDESERQAMSIKAKEALIKFYKDRIS